MASMSEARRRYTRSSPRSLTRGWLSWSSRPISWKCWRSASASWSSPKAGSWRSFRARRRRKRRSWPPPPPISRPPMRAPEAKQARAGVGEFALRLRVSGVLAFIVLLGALFGLLSPRFLNPQNLEVIASNAAILAIVAAAQAVVLLTRNLDVSVGSIMGFAAYLTADYAARHHGAGIEIIGLAMLLGALLGALNGLIVAYANVSPLIATLGAMSLYRGATYIYAHGQDITSNKLPHWMLAAVDFRVADLPALPLLSALVVALISLFLRRFAFGRQIYAVGSNPEAAVYYGLRVKRVTLFAYAFSG